MTTPTKAARLAGRYRVLRRLGSGGMASVLLCRDERLGREVAVKRLHAASPEDVARRFAREARVGASLNHPNVVSVFDTLTDEDGVLIVMEYVAGETLAQALQRGPLDSRRALAVIHDVAAALDHVHDQGVVHRDVKPANVLLSTEGRAKLVDLGIATAADSTRITGSGVVLGTAAYMAPEQLDGAEVGPAADVFALAAVAFEALGGGKARPGRTPLEIVQRAGREGPRDLREDWPEAPAAVAQALRRGLAARPEERQASAGALAGELAAGLEGERTAPTRPIAAPPPRRRRPARRGPALVLAALTAGLVALVVALSAGDSGDSGEAGDERSVTPSEPRGEEAQREQPQRQEPERPAPASGSGAQLNAQGFALMNQGRYEAAIPVLERAVEAFPSGTGDLQYAYALYNLGRSLRLAGRPAEAVPILERRLEIPNQRGTVKRELKAARRDAGR